MYFKNTILITLTIITPIISIMLALVLSEHYFFDKVIYQKSPLHRYVKDNFFTIKKLSKNPITKSRIRDLNTLYSFEDTKVLGNSSHKDIFTVAVISDSMAYGQGVRSHQTFPYVLEKKLNEVRSTKVYNLSLPGDDFVDNYSKFLYAKKNSKLIYIYSQL